MAGAGGRRWRLVRGRTGPVPPSVRRFSRRARQRRLRALRPWAAGLVVALILGAAWWTVANTSLVAVRTVRVTGTSLLTPFEVTHAAAVPTGGPMLRVDTDAVAARVGVLPAVGDVTVRRDWPTTIHVAVRERSAVAAVPTGEVYRWVDSAGVVFHTGPSAGLPVVRLTTPGPEDPPTRTALRVLAVLPPALARQVQELDVASPAKVALVLRGKRRVLWGDETDSDRKARAAAALLRGDHRVIDVSSIDVVSVRPR